MTLQQVITELKAYDGDTIRIMEVCGTHTASIFKNGIRSLIAPQIKLLSGPGSPVCVTSSTYIDKLVAFSLNENHCVLTFGDMMKVKGSTWSLTEAQARGGMVKILYSPLDAIEIANTQKHTEFIFAAVGFETTTPIYAILLEAIVKNDIKNLKLITSLKTIVPAISFICENEAQIDAFLCPGHVSVITGCNIYKELAAKYRKPFVVAGFEGAHILLAIYEIVHQIQNKAYEMKNLYPNAVSEMGNEKALKMMADYFEITDDYWRGIGMIEKSALKLRPQYRTYDAGSTVEIRAEQLPQGCRCKEVILGRADPSDCPLFAKKCSPLNAIGPCMVSTEGVCGIWYKNREV